MEVKKGRFWGGLPHVCIYIYINICQQIMYSKNPSYQIRTEVKSFRDAGLALFDGLAAELKSNGQVRHTNDREKQSEKT